MYLNAPLVYKIAHMFTAITREIIFQLKKLCPCVVLHSFVSYIKYIQMPFLCRYKSSWGKWGLCNRSAKQISNTYNLCVMFQIWNSRIDSQIWMILRHEKPCTNCYMKIVKQNRSYASTNYRHFKLKYHNNSIFNFIISFPKPRFDDYVILWRHSTQCLASIIFKAWWDSFLL